MHDRIEIPGFTAIARHSWLTIFVAKFVPIALFLATLPRAGVDTAVLVALGWSLGVVVFQHHTGQRISGLVVLSVVGNLTKSVLALATGSMIVYFAQPTLSTFIVGLVFLGSVVLGRPMAARLIGDLCPFDDSTSSHPEFHRFFRSATLLWAGSSMLNGVITLYLLLTLSLTDFLVTKAFLGPTLSAMTLGVGLVWFRRRMRRVGVEVVFAARVPALVS